MFIDDYIEKITLQEMLKNVKEQLKAVQEENTELKAALDWHRKANGEKRSILLERNEQIAKLVGDINKLKGELQILKHSNSAIKKNAAECKKDEKNEELDAAKIKMLDHNHKDDEGFGDGEINCSDADFLKYRLSNKEGKIEELKAKVEMLENDRKENLVVCADCSHGQQYQIKQLEDELSKSNAEKQELKAKIEMLSRDADKIFKEKRQKEDNLRNRIKDLEAEIDQLKSNYSTVSDSEMMAIHTADVETINKLDIQVHDLNNTITTLLDILSKSTDENQELKKKVQELKDTIKDLGAKLYK